MRNEYPQRNIIYISFFPYTSPHYPTFSNSFPHRNRATLDQRQHSIHLEIHTGTIRIVIHGNINLHPLFSLKSPMDFSKLEKNPTPYPQIVVPPMIRGSKYDARDRIERRRSDRKTKEKKKK